MRVRLRDDGKGIDDKLLREEGAKGITVCVVCESEPS
jgi:hypothetical protein